MAVAAAATAATLAFAKGPPPEAVVDPVPNTVVASGSGRSDLVRPARRTDGTIERAVVAARGRATPKAVRAARAEAARLAAAAGLRLGPALAIAQEVAPPGYWDQSTGRFGPGKHCGRIPRSRWVRRADGTRRRVTRWRRGCVVPRDAQLRVRMTFATAD